VGMVASRARLRLMNPDNCIRAFGIKCCAADWTEFLVRAKAQLDGEVLVYHCCKPVRGDAKNRLIFL